MTSGDAVGHVGDPLLVQLSSLLKGYFKGVRRIMLAE